MNVKQATRRVQLAQYLLDLPKSEFEYSTISEVTLGGKITNKKVEVTCNTVACAYGHCPNVFPKNFRSNIGDVLSSESITINGRSETYSLEIEVKGPDGKWYGDYDSVDFEDEEGDSRSTDGSSYYAQKFFGMSDEEFSNIFMACDCKSTYGVNDSFKVTKEMVAQKLFDTVKEAGYSVV